MNRRRLIFGSLAAAVVGGPSSAVPRNVRVGYLELVSASGGEVLYREFVEGLQRHGYVEGRNLRVIRRSADGRLERVRPLATELATEKVDVILAASTEAARSAKIGAPRVPTVFVISTDPVLEGLVGSLARPGGTLTGLTSRGEDLTAKRLELLKEAFPRIQTVAVVGSNLSMAAAAFDDAAARLQLAVLRFPVNQSDEYRDAAAAVARSAVDAVLVVEDIDAVTSVGAFTRVIMAARRPTMFTAEIFVEEFGLMAFGASQRQQYRRAADIVARVLEGAKPSAMPVELPTRYELVVNRRAAEQAGIAIPREFLLRADRVIG